MIDSSFINQIGLTEVYRSSPESPCVDIVFIHGLNGHPYSTWASEDQHLFWPADLLPDILGPRRVRILTYGYDASVHTFTDGVSSDHIHNHAETLASKLAANRNLRGCSDRPIIFVCHSLGGLVVKRALIHCKNVSNEKIEHLRSIYVSTYGILFLGTPHNGSDIARWGALLQNICSAVLPKKIFETSPHLINALKTNNETLQNINSLFAEIIGRFHVYFFHESRSTDVRGTRTLIVDESSAAPYMEGVERMGIDADHRHMCKFDSENAPGYEAIAEALVRYSRDSPATISTRWHEEMNHRALARQAKAQELFERSVCYQSGRSGQDPRPSGNSPVSRYVDEGPPAPLEMTQDVQLSISYHLETKPLFVTPLGFHPNSIFIGMEFELELLHTHLFKESKRADRLTAVVISGPPGSGKSHLAREYVWTRRDSYPGGIFWLDAKSTQSICNGFWDIAQAAVLVESQVSGGAESQARTPHWYIDVVREWLQSREEWLLIFDGIYFGQEEDINEFKKFLPFNKRCSIIYTSVDKTLRRRQRLFEPYCLKLAPLRVEDACKLLFKDLGIKKPTPGQIRKATELVRYYECLPLAIHAISHRLSATSKPIEKYHIYSHLTDEKLAEPFLGIMNDLYRVGHFEALNLINIMSFFGHHIPVGLITLGRSVLTPLKVEILTPSRPGEQGDIDTTLGILIRCGLIERVTDTYAVHYSASQRSDNGSFEAKPTTSELSDSQLESSQDASFSSSTATRATDVIKIHSVVQGFCRDEFKIMDEEEQQQQQRVFSETNKTGYYDSWLLVAFRVLRKSFENANTKTVHHVLTKDYREYEAHASRLLEHFPKKVSTLQVVREARDELRLLVERIRSEIARTSLNSSHSSIRKQISVFDRSSSSSSSIPDSSTDEDQLQLTWDWSDTVSSKAESPGDISMLPCHFNLTPFPPHIYRESSLDKEKRCETDIEDARTMTISSPAMIQGTGTLVPPRLPSSNLRYICDDKSYLAENGLRHLRENLAQKYQRELPRELRRSRPAVPMLNVFQVSGRSSTDHGSAERCDSLTSSEAGRALAAMQRVVRPLPSSHKGPSGAIGFQFFGKENAPSYAITAEPELTQRSSSLPSEEIHNLRAKLQGKPSSESLDSQAAGPQVSRHFAEIKSDNMAHSAYSEAYRRPIWSHLSYPDAATAPGTRYHSRNSSYATHVETIGNMTASTPGLVYYPSAGPREEDNHMIRSQRHFGSSPMAGSGGQLVSGNANSHPSAFMPGSSPPHSYGSDPLGGNMSELTVSEPMSRGPSGYSSQSLLTEPTAQYTKTVLPIQTHQGMMYSSHLGLQHHLIHEAGGWIGDAQTSSGSYKLEETYIGLALGGQQGEQPERHYDLYTNNLQNLHSGRTMVDVWSGEKLVGHPRYSIQQQTPGSAFFLSQEESAVPDGWGARPRRGSSPVWSKNFRPR